MNNARKMMVALAVAVAVTASYATLVSALQADAAWWEEHHTEMAELHRQYATGEITFGQFREGMAEEMNEAYAAGYAMPCHGGYAAGYYATAPQGQPGSVPQYGPYRGYGMMGAPWG